MFCPKCGHERTATDDPDIPEDQCPACGIYYFKYIKYINQKNDTIKSKLQNHEKPAIANEEVTTNEVPIKSLDTLSMRIKLLIRFVLRQMHHVWNKVTQKIPFVLRQTQHVWNKVILRAVKISVPNYPKIL